MLSHFSKSRTHFSVFRKQKGILLSHFSKSCTHFGVFRKQKGILLSHFSKSRTHNNYNYVAKAIADLAEYSQAD